MHAIAVRVSISDFESSRKELDEKVVPRVSNAPGFVAGYWTLSEDKSNGLALLVFESEDAARAVEGRLRDDAPQGVTIESTEVREVVASA